MKKLWKKVIPLLMAAAMLTLGVTVCAETTTTLGLSYDKDTLVVTSTAEVKITNIPEKSTTTEGTTYYDVSFTTYQVVYAVYDSTTNTITYKLTAWAKAALVDSTVSGKNDYDSNSGYSATAGKYSSEEFALAALYALATSNTDATTNSDDQETLVNTLAAYSSKTGYSSASWTQSNDTASADLPVGVYLVIPSSSEMSFLNMMVSVEAKASGSSNTWTTSAKGAILKGNTVGITKKVEEGSSSTAAKSDTADAQIGESVTYTITVDVPHFAESETNSTITFTVKDALAKVNINTSTIKIYGVASDGTETELTNTNTTTVYTIDTTTDTGYLTIDLSEDYMNTFYSNGNWPYVTVKIVYTAELDSDANINSANTNTATLTWDDSNHSENTASDSATVYTYQATVTKKNDDDTNSTLLQGAEFSVTVNGSTISFVEISGTTTTTYKVADATDISDESITTTTALVTGSDGMITLRGLDSGTEYVIEETKAPSGYTLNSNVLGFSLTATNPVSAYINTYTTTEYTDDTLVTEVSSGNVWSVSYLKDSSENLLGAALSLTDTTLPSLPATGSIGIIIFTIAGVAIMILALVLINSGKSKQKKA